MGRGRAKKLLSHDITSPSDTAGEKPPLCAQLLMEGTLKRSYYFQISHPFIPTLINMNQNHQPSFCRQSKNAWVQELQFSEDWFNSPRSWHQHTPMRAKITGTCMPEDAKCQNTSPTSSSCITTPIFTCLRSAAGWRLPARRGRQSLPTQASTASTGLEAHSGLSLIATRTLQAWFHGLSHSRSFCRPPALPQRGSALAGWSPVITTCATCSEQVEITSHSPMV